MRPWEPGKRPRTVLGRKEKLGFIAPQNGLGEETKEACKVGNRGIYKSPEMVGEQLIDRS